MLISSEAANTVVREARAEKAVDNSVNAEIEVHRLGGTYWASLRDWARKRDVLTPKEIGIVETCAAIPRKMPSEKQCAIALVALEKAKSEGFES